MAVAGLGILGVGILGMAAIFHTQRRHLQNVRSLEEEIHRNERLSELGNLAAAVAHEIRNPLNSISIGMQRLKAEFIPVQDAGEYSHFLTLMQEEVQRLNRIVEQFLSLIPGGEKARLETQTARFARFDKKAEPGPPWSRPD